MKIISFLILVKTYLASIATILPYSYIKNTSIPIQEDIDTLLVLNTTHTIVSGLDGRVYSCSYSDRFKCDSIIETSSRNIFIS